MFFCKMLACGRFDAGICRLPHRQTGEFPGFWVDLFGKLCLTETVGLLRTPDRHLPEKNPVSGFAKGCSPGRLMEYGGAADGD